MTKNKHRQVIQKVVNQGRTGDGVIWADLYDAVQFYNSLGQEERRKDFSKDSWNMVINILGCNPRPAF